MIKIFITWLVLIGSACLRAADPTELSFGIISTESAVGLKQGFDPFLEKISAQLGIRIRGYYASDYTGVIEAMRFGKVHVAWMGNQAAMHAVDRAGAEIIAQTTSADGSSGYASVIIVHEKSSYRDIAALLADAGKLSFGNGDPLSTTGNLVPSFYLWAPRGIDPRRAFKRVRSANHEVNALAVVSGQVDCATNNTDSLRRLGVKHPAAAAKIRVVWTSPDVATDPIVCRRDLSRELKTRLQAALLAFGRLGADAAEERAMLARVSDGWGPFLAADNRLLLPFRHFEVERDRLILQQDERLPAPEKEKRLTAVAARQRKLEKFETLETFWNRGKENP